MYQAVIFDLDGTLLNTIGDLAAAANHALRAMGLPQHSVDEYRYMVGNGIPKLIERMLPDSARGEASRAVAHELFQRRYAEHMADATAPYPGIPQLLDGLAARGIVTAVVSNKDDAFVKGIVARYFPSHAFCAVIGRRDGIPAKPDPASVSAALTQMGADPARSLYVGDSDVDVETAHNAHLACCGAAWGFRGRGELERAGAEFIAEDAEELLRVILGE